jgi:hypothetical protein
MSVVDDRLGYYGQNPMFFYPKIINHIVFSLPNRIELDRSGVFVDKKCKNILCHELTEKRKKEE